MKIVGYLEGTDSSVLTRLVANGYETVPLGNGWDNHGKYIGHIGKGDNIGVVVGYLHKIIPFSGQTVTVDNILFACKINNIPFVVIASREDHEKSKALIPQGACDIRWTTPDKLYDDVVEILK